MWRLPHPALLTASPCPVAAAYFCLVPMASILFSFYFIEIIIKKDAPTRAQPVPLLQVAYVEVKWVVEVQFSTNLWIQFPCLKI
jgi:hypothetical protein